MYLCYQSQSYYLYLIISLIHPDTPSFGCTVCKLDLIAQYIAIFDSRRLCLRSV